MQAVEPFVEAATALVHPDAGGGVLGRRPAEPQPGVQPARGEHVERRELLGQGDRRIERAIDYGHAEPGPLGHRGGEAQRDHRVQDALVDPGELLVRQPPLKGPQPAEAVRLGVPGQSGDVRRSRPGARGGRANPSGTGYSPVPSSTCPPKACRIADSSLSAYTASPRLEKRGKNPAGGTGAGTPSSIAAFTAPRPSPESETRPAIPASSGFACRAPAVRSSSQDETTEP